MIDISKIGKTGSLNINCESTTFDSEIIRRKIPRTPNLKDIGNRHPAAQDKGSIFSRNHF